jgi:hypothetical protein
MWVTSASEVLMPRFSDRICVFLDQSLNRAKVSRRQAIVLRKLDIQVQPELRLSTMAMDVHVHARLLTGEEKEAKAALTQNGWTHF